MGFLFFLLMCFGIGKFAQHRGRSAVGWGLASAFISPILAGIILACLKDLSTENELEKNKADQSQLQERVAVNEMRTNQRLDNVEKQITQIRQDTGMLTAGAAEPKKIAGNTKECPHCGSIIKKSATKCRFCGSELEVQEQDTMECPYCKEFIPKTASICKYCRSEIKGNNLATEDTVQNSGVENTAVVEDTPGNEIEAVAPIEEKNLAQEITQDGNQQNFSLLCPSCHSILLPNAKFCSNCGAMVASEDK